MEDSWYFCNDWECEYRKNEKHKNEMLCDHVWDDECPYDEEFYKSLNNVEGKNVKN